MLEGLAMARERRGRERGRVLQTDYDGAGRPEKVGRYAGGVLTPYAEASMKASLPAHPYADSNRGYIRIYKAEPFPGCPLAS